MELELVAEGLATRARTIDGVTAYPHTPHSVSVPAFIVLDMDARLVGGCVEQLRVTCGLVTTLTDDPAVRKRLWQYAAATGEWSVLAALEAEPTLGGVCTDVTVASRRVPRTLTVATKEYLAAELLVEVDGGIQ